MFSTMSHTGCILTGWRIVVICLTAVQMTRQTYASKILLLPGPGEGSHYTTMKHIGVELVNRGHSVTVLLSDVYADRRHTKDAGELFSLVTYTSMHSPELFQEYIDAMVSAGFQGNFPNVSMSDGLKFQVEECEAVIGDTELVGKLKHEKFDVILGDMILNCPAVIAEQLSVPLVAFTTTTTFPAITRLFNIPNNPSYVPDMMTQLTHQMNSFERLQNSLMYLFGYVYFYYVALPSYTQLKIKYDIEPGVPIETSIAKAKLWLFHTDFALEFPRPLMPNVALIGGLTAKDATPLGQNLEEFFESSGEHGVVLFSMGTFNVDCMGESKAEMFAAALGRLRQKVIWKYDGSPPRNLGNNTKLMTWFPQNDILGHPKTKLLISHGGINSVFEAIYHGVPIVGMPLFADQFDILTRVAAKEFGKTLITSTVTEDELVNATNEVIGTKRYKENALRLSGIFRDHPHKPAERAAYWIEYVIKYDGADHLRSQAFNLTIIQYYILDVIAAIFVGFVVAMFALKWSMYYAIKQCRSSPMKQKQH